MAPFPAGHARGAEVEALDSGRPAGGAGPGGARGFLAILDLRSSRQMQRCYNPIGGYLGRLDDTGGCWLDLEAPCYSLV